MSSSSSSPRRYVVGGNWKCNGTRASVGALVSALNSAKLPSNVDVVVAPTYLHIDLVQRSLSNPAVQLAAQDCVEFKNGAYTGEVSAEMIKDFGVNWVILGHSERRHIFNTDDQTVAQQIKFALDSDLKVIACVGETLKEREENRTIEIIDMQMGHIAGAVNDWSNVVVAYEPVWAIGTGRTASPAQAQEVHAHIRKWMADKYGAGVADALRIIYGGSVKADNALELAKQADIDGFLVGGASLKADEFVSIVNAASRESMQTAKL